MISHDTGSGAAKAGVVGSGIAGLCAAIALRRAGWEVEVLERSKSKSEIGAAITITSPSTAILDHWGFDFQKAQPVENNKLSIQLSHDLQTVYDEQYPDIVEKFGHKILSFHRVDLYRGLLEVAQEEDDINNTKGIPVSVQQGCEVKSVDCENGTIVLQDDREFKKDLVVIADGAHSRLLEQFAGPQYRTEPTGRSIYRILLPMDKVISDPDLRQFYENKLSGFVCFLDPVENIFFINYPCRNSTILNLAIVHGTDNTKQREGTWARPSSVAEALEKAKNFHPTLKKYIHLANDEDVTIHDTYMHAPLDSFVRGRALILGDAAHVMLPTHASGCSVAIEAASTLELLFRSVTGDDSDTIAKRLAMFDKLAIPRCNMVMILSNSGHGGLGDPKVQAQIRKYYPHPMPSADDGIWSPAFREMLFGYNSLAEAEKLLSVSG